VVSATVERAARKFHDRVSARLITTVVTWCIADLSGIAQLALPELSERAARQRLLAYLAAPGEPGPLAAPRVDAGRPRGGL